MKYLTLPALVLTVVTPHLAVANHGPATSAGGVASESAEPLDEGRVSVVVREHFTSFEDLSRDAIQSRADKGGEFDYLKKSYITTLGTTYGVADDIDLGTSIGWYAGRGFVNAEGSESAESGEAEEPAFGNPTGLTDLTLRGRFRVASTKGSSFALLSGVVVPTGDRSERLSNGNTLDPSSQPGTGRFGVQGGVAFTQAVSSTVKLDSSGVYTYRFERDDVRVGDRLDTGVALSLKATDAHAGCPGISIFGELNHIWLDKDKSPEGVNQNSGGNTVFLTAGVRVDVGEAVSLALAPSVPVYQKPNGEQAEVDFKVTGLITVRL